MSKEMQELQKGNFTLYSFDDKSVQVEVYFKNEDIWLTQKLMAELFDVQRPAITKHLKNIFESKELQENSVSSILEHTASDGKGYKTKYYNLDAIISVGYRVNSTKATAFRIWATKTLKEHILRGYTINKNRISYNYEQFMNAVADVQALLPSNDGISARNVLDLVNTFASTWFSLDAYDSQKFLNKGLTKKNVNITADELQEALVNLKQDQLKKKQATDIFAVEKVPESVAGIVGNVLQGFGGKDIYPSIEEKAAHLLYFMIKNHPFVDGNKRSGAFAFVWFLRKNEVLRDGLTPEALTALTLLIAESNPDHKDKMIGLVLLLLRSN